MCVSGLISFWPKDGLIVREAAAIHNANVMLTDDADGVGNRFIVAFPRPEGGPHPRPLPALRPSARLSQSRIPTATLELRHIRASHYNLIALPPSGAAGDGRGYIADDDMRLMLVASRLDQ